MAGELGINRRMVARHAAKCAGEVTPGMGEAILAEGPLVATRARSQGEEQTVVIAGKVARGLSARRIYQDLVAGHGFEASYQVGKAVCGEAQSAGAEAGVARPVSARGGGQVDFGLGAMIEDVEGGGGGAGCFGSCRALCARGIAKR